MFLEGSLDQAATRLSELNDPAAAVLRVGCPPEEFSRFQAIDGSSDRTAREQNLFPDNIHGLWSLVQKHFQYREVGRPNADTLRRAFCSIAWQAFHNTSQTRVAASLLRLGKGSTNKGTSLRPSGFHHGTLDIKCHLPHGNCIEYAASSQEGSAS